MKGIIINNQFNLVYVIMLLVSVPLLCAKADIPGTQQYSVSVTVKAAPGIAEALQNSSAVLNISSNGRTLHRESLVINQRYQFVLPKGKYNVQALHYTPRYEKRMLINVPQDSEVELELREPKRHHLEIKIIAEDGSPVEGCPVRLRFSGVETARFHLSNSFTQETVTTDANGIARFSLEGTIPDKCELRILDRRLHRPSRTNVYAAEWNQEKPLDVEVSRKIYNGTLNIILLHNGVVDPIAKNIRNIIDGEVKGVLRLYSGSNQISYYSYRLKDSAVAIYGLKDGEYVVDRLEVIDNNANVLALAPASMNDAIIPVKDGAIMPDAKSLVFTTKAAAEVTHQIRVTANGDPVVGAHVDVSSIVGATRSTAVTDAEGACVIRLIPGEYQLQVSHNNYETRSERLVADSAGTIIVIPLHKRPVVRGVVTYQDAPLGDVSVVMSMGPHKGKKIVKTDQEGAYEFVLRDDGNFYIGVDYMGFTDFKEVKRQDSYKQEIHIEAAQRIPVQLQIDLADRIILNRSAIFIVPKDIGEIAASIDLSEDVKQPVNMYVIAGVYEIYLISLPTEKANRPENYILYDFGGVTFNEHDQKAVLKLKEDEHAMSIETLFKRLDTRSSLVDSGEADRGD